MVGWVCGCGFNAIINAKKGGCNRTVLTEKMNKKDDEYERSKTTCRWRTKLFQVILIETLKIKMNMTMTMLEKKLKY